MIKSLKVIAGDFKSIWKLVFLNCIHLILQGIPFGILFLVITELLKPKNELNMKFIIILMLIMGIIMVVNIFVAVKVHVNAYINSYSLTTQTRLKLGDHLRKLSLGFFKKRDPGDISSLLLQDMAKVEKIFSNFFIDAAACAVLPFIMICFFVFVDLKLSGIMILTIAASLPCLILGQKIIVYFGKGHIQTRNDVASRLLEYLQGIKILSAFNLTGKGFSRLDEVLKKFCKDSIRLEASAGVPVMTYSAMLELGFICTVISGFYFYDGGNLELGALLVFMIVGYKFFEPLLNFGLFSSEMKYMGLAANRITEVMECEPLKEPDNPLEVDDYSIKFTDVDFGYGKRKVIKNFNAQFKADTITALVGPSGGGKTTLTSLIARFWDVDKGKIEIGGIDIKNLNTQYLNSLLSVVFQDVYLFQDTIFNNIKVGKKDASYEEVIEASKKACCHDFIMNLENGYETMAGEAGAMLSGGEKQRISIARALLKDAPIVLLDEATASLDPENEIHIQQAIKEMIRSKTLVVIAHRLKTIENADNIIVLDNGEIAEQGVHKDLLLNKNIYWRLWTEQQKAGGWKFSSRSVNKEYLIRKSAV